MKTLHLRARFGPLGRLSLACLVSLFSSMSISLVFLVLICLFDNLDRPMLVLFMHAVFWLATPGILVVALVPQRVLLARS